MGKGTIRTRQYSQGDTNGVSRGVSTMGGGSMRSSRNNDYDSDDMPARRVATPQKPMRKPMRPLKDR